MKLQYMHFSKKIEIDFNPDDLIYEAAFGETTTEEIVDFIKKLGPGDRDSAYQLLKSKVDEITSSDDPSDVEVKGSAIVKQALELI